MNKLSALFAILAVPLTLYFNHAFFGPVAASLLIGFLGFIISKLVKNDLIGVAIFAGTFTGMSSDIVLKNIYQVVIASILTGIFFYVLQNRFKGVGGKLGFIGFLSVFTTFIITFPIWS